MDVEDTPLVERKIVYIKESSRRSWAKFALPESIKSKIAQEGTLDHPGFIDLIENLNEDGNKCFLYFTKNIYANFEILDKTLKLRNADNIILLNYKDIKAEPSLKPLPLLMAFLEDIRGEVLVPVNGLSFVTEANKQSVTIKSLIDEAGEVTLDSGEFLEVWGKNDFIFLGISDSEGWGGIQYMFNNLNNSGAFADKGVFDYLINNSFSDLKEVLDRFFVNCRIMRCGGCDKYLTVNDYDTVRVFCAKCSKELKILKRRKIV